MKNYYLIATTLQTTLCGLGQFDVCAVKGHPDVGDVVNVKESLVRVSNPNYDMDQPDDGTTPIWLAQYAVDKDVAGPWLDKWVYGVVHAVGCPGSHIRFRFKVAAVIHPFVKLTKGKGTWVETYVKLTAI